jgi:tetratricopeptide (TPR) repeat protein
MRLVYDRWDANDVRVCEAADRVLRGSGETTAAGFDRVIYAHVQALRGDAGAALRTADAGIPGSNETTSVTVHLLALSAQILALLQVGRFGDALRIIREGQETAQKNGSDPWLFLYREAWLRTLAMDFPGAQRICGELIRSSVYPTGQAQAIAHLAAGFEALDQGRHEEAGRHFEHVCDPTETPKFFLHWYWRVHARVGLTRAWLQSGHMTNARREADRLIDAAVATADSNLRALAWDARARVAMAESNWTDAGQFIDQALTALLAIDASQAAWQVHNTAARLYRRTGQPDRAAAHHTHAVAHVAALADSLPRGEPLRDALLHVPAVRRIHSEELEVG